MKLQKSVFTLAVATALGVVVAGCKTHTTVAPVSNGYEEVDHPQHTLIDEPPPPRISFQYRNADGTVTKIWPSLYGAGEAIHGDTAIFVAEKAYLEPDRSVHPRLFAVKAPALPIDITDEVLWLWARDNHKNFNQALNNFSMITPQVQDGKLQLRVDFWTHGMWGAGQDNWPDESTMTLDWRQVDEIMQRLKAKGVVKKDLRWKTEYIGQ